MKRELWVVLLAFLLGLLLWVVDAALDSIFFYSGSFWDLLFVDVPLHELYMRTTILFLFTVIGVIVARVLGKRRLAEVMLDAKAATIQSIFRAAPTGIGMVRDRVFTEVNERVTEMTGYSSEELLGQSARILYASEEEFQRSRRNMYEEMRREGTGSVETEWRHKDGHLLDILLSSTPVDPDNWSIGVTFTALDITARKRTEHIMRFLVEEMSAKTGEAFFGSMVECLARAIHVRYAFVGQLSKPECLTIQTLAVWDGSEIAENIEYSLLGMPCQNVVGKVPCLYGRDVRKLFPESRLLDDMNIEAYLGMPLTSSSGEPLGVLVGMDDRPFPKEMEDYVQPLLKSLAARATAELERLHAVEALQQSEQRFRQLADNVPEVFWVTTPDWSKVLYISPSYERIWQRKCEDLYTNPEGWLDAIVPEDYTKVRDCFRGRSPTDRFPIVLPEYRILQLDGTMRWISTRGFPVEDENGDVYRLVGISEDITERKQSEQALLLDESRLETLVQLNQMSDASMKELTNFALEEAVRLTRSTLGYLAFLNDDETVLTMHAWSGGAMEECEIRDKPLIYSLETTGLWGEAVRQRKPIVTNDYAAPSPLKKGYPKGHVPMRRHMNVPIFDGEHIVAVAGVGNKTEPYDDSDIRQLTLLMDGMWKIIRRRQTEEKLRENEERLSLALNVSDATLWTWNPQTDEVYLDDAYLAIIGRRREEIPKTLRESKIFHHPDDWDSMIAGMNANLQGKTSVHECEVRILAADGQWKWMAGRAKIIQWDEMGKPKLMLGTSVDITKRKTAEAEREKLIAKLEAQNAELERFAYTVSHDLKSPLITIKGYLGLLEKDVAEGDVDVAAADLARMASAADKMWLLLGDLLELSRVGRAVNPPQDIPFAELVGEAVDLVRGQIEAAGIHIEVATDIPDIFGDRPRLLEVMQNLIDNAAKYMGDQAEPRIEIAARRSEDPTVWTVRDNGIGIDWRYKEKIFGLFDQLDKKVEGSGVGLALVKRIIEVHGGRIWVESKGEGLGSTFCFTLPPKESQAT